MIKTVIDDADYKLNDNPDGTRTITFSDGFDVTFRCLNYSEYMNLKPGDNTQVEAHVMASVKGTEQEKKDLFTNMTFQEGTNLWLEIYAFKPVNFRKKPSQKS